MFGLRKYKFSKKDKRLAELRALQIVLAILIGLLLASGVAFWQISKDKMRLMDLRQEARQVDIQQTVPPRGAKIGGPFTLINQDGKAVTDADFRGKYLLVYFGYTYCPDLCPTGLESIAHAMDKLGKDAGKIQPLFITIDPVRDTAQKLKEYDASFHPTIIGLTGSPEQIASVAKAYQVYYAKAEQVDEDDYVMDHSSLIYLMDPEGKFVTTFGEEASPDEIVKTLREQWAKKTSSAKP